MAADSSRSAGPTADSYIGSLISLTSKCEIRYEGILYDINTQESSIGLRNVRSFGTEGRKDGPQILASDKIYEYILFRGSDIKDILVKSPPVENASIQNDPAIIQLHYSHPSSSSTSLPTIGNGSVADPSSHTAQLGLPRPTFQENLPLYHPGGSLINGSGLAMPMYWPGFYAPTGGLPHLQQTPLFRPPQGMPLQYPGLNASLQNGSQNVPEISPPLFPPVSTAQSLTSTMFPSTVALNQASILAPESASNLMANKTPLTTLPAPTLGANLPLLPPPLTSNNDSLVTISQNMPSIISSKPMTVTASTLGYQTLSQSMPSIVGSSFARTSGYQTATLGQAMPSIVSSSNSNIVESSVSSMTPDQLLSPGPSTNPSSQPLQMSHKDVESKPQEAKKKPAGSESIVQPSAKPKEAKEKPSASESFVQPSAKSKEPILPLPKPSYPKPNGFVMHNHHYNRGRGKGRRTGYSRPIAKFAEDFDFTAMNEKFNKDEVWGHLGKSKALSHDMEGGGKDDEEGDNLEGEAAESHKPEVKPVYVKDNFFDTLSSNTHDRGIRGGRTRFSQQLEIDTETFGDFPRHRPNWGGRGGRGPRGGGVVQTRGSYYGRGNIGYVPRGRGHAVSNRAS